MFPGKLACGSCHVDLDFTKHAGGQNDDSKCATCHVPDSGKEWDISVTGAHLLEYNTTQGKNYVVTIVSASNVAPGKSPTVVMKVVDKTGAKVDPSKLATFSPMFGGPTSDYGAGTWVPVPPSTTPVKGYFREDARAKGVYDAAAGTFTYTFLGKIPTDLKGSVGFTADVRNSITIYNADGSVRNAAYRDNAVNPFYYVSLDPAVAAVPRRTVVTIAQCNKCHDKLALHGGQRNQTQECVFCHNPTNTGTSPAGAESIDMKRMAHRIHTGENLTQTYQIGTFIANEITYPGDRRNCVTCHTSTGYYPSTDPTRLSTVTATDYFTPQGPTTAACLGCHDARAFAAHAYLNTAPFGEACQACHGAGNAYGVDVVHAR
jgi:OmcA/MtrC family decaheme c-type cytochrome